MKVISFINYKGGVGKTTLTANLASELAFRGNRVLMVDLDPQSSLTFSFIAPDAWDENYQKSKTIKNWYESFTRGVDRIEFSDLIVHPKEVNARIEAWGSEGTLDLICSHLALINVDLELSVLVVGANPRQTATNFLQTHYQLRRGFETIKEKYDFVIIDCPPNFNLSTQTGIVASDYYVIPANPDYLSTLGIDQLEAQVKRLVEDYNHYAAQNDDCSEIDPRSLGVVFTMMSLYGKAPIAIQRTYIAQVRRKNIRYFNTFIRENKRVYGSAPEVGIPVSLQEGNNQTELLLRSELESLADEILERISSDAGG